MTSHDVARQVMQERDAECARMMGERSRLGRRVAVLPGYTAHARFAAGLLGDVAGYIPREVPTPYASGPTHTVWTRAADGLRVIIAETRHRRYEVFEVVGDISSRDW